MRQDSSQNQIQSIMKYIYYNLLLLLITSSCASSYHAYVVAENPNLDFTQNEGFILNYDSVKVKFSFSGENMPLRIMVDNQSQKGLFIDWNKSALIFDGFLLSIVNPDSQEDMTAINVEVWDGDVNIQIPVARTSELPKRYIPPKSKYAFKMRSFHELRPTDQQLASMRELLDGSMHPTAGSLDNKIYKDYQSEYPELRVVLDLYAADNPEKSYRLDQIFYMTQQYKVEAQDNSFGTMTYADRGYFIFEENNTNGGVAAAMLTTLSSLLFLLMLNGANP